MRFCITNRTLFNKLIEQEKIMSTLAAGLAALTQAQADEAAAIQANTAATTQVVAEIATLTAQLSSLNSEDPQVATIAADLEAKVATLQQNTAALTAAITPASTTAAPAAPAPPVPPSAGPEPAAA